MVLKWRSAFMNNKQRRAFFTVKTGSIRSVIVFSVCKKGGIEFKFRMCLRLKSFIFKIKETLDH